MAMTQRPALSLSSKFRPLTPDEQLRDEVDEAEADLERSHDGFFHFPWAAVDAVVKGMPGGEVCYVGAFSGHGKTTFLSSLTDEIFDRMQAKVFYMGLESRPKILRTHWACKRLGYDTGDLLSGGYLQRPDADEMRAAVQAELRSQSTGDKAARVRFCGTPYVTAKSLWTEAKLAEKFGASVFIIDHVDHIAGAENKSDYSQSLEVNRAILDIAQTYGFLMLVATQFNLDAARGRRMALHLAPQPSFVKMGNHKREVATWMLGLYRPRKLSGVPKDVITRFNATGEGRDEVLEPNAMAVYVMKHRIYGALEGQTAIIGVEKGKIVPFCPRDLEAIDHGIATTRRSYG